MNFIDAFLNRTTMYRLVLYYLLALLAFAVLFCYFGVLSFAPMSLVLSTVYVTAICWLINTIFSRTLKAPTNVESLYITALILVFLIPPPNSFGDLAFYSLAGLAAMFAMASKYILAIKKKHIFNPAAIAVVITAFAFGQAASWWIGTPFLVMPVIIGGLLMARKVRRVDFVVAFFVASLVVILAPHIYSFSDMWKVLNELLLSSPIIFFSAVMLTEPLTTPPDKISRIAYGVLVGALFSPMVHVGSLYSTPELALVVGNVFSYVVSPKQKLLLRLKEVKTVGNNTYDFIFGNNQPFSFKAGQYMEWTLPHKHPDNRGNRRYFTIASSPTERDLRIGVKFYPPSSSFKQTLALLPQGGVVATGALAGNFTLPRDKDKKLVFIAGGIGVTPFRSMVKYLIDKKEKRSIILFYSNNTLADVAYTEIFDEAYEELGLKIVYTLTDLVNISDSWKGERGFIDAKMIVRHMPDFAERIFYLSGPHAMVTRYEHVLAEMGVKKSHIKTDFFPGFA